MNKNYLFELFKLRLNKLLYLLIKPYLLKFYIKGIAPSFEHKLVLQSIIEDNELDAIIDVGSNKGQFALMVDLLGFSRNIYSFDPLESSKLAFSLIKEKRTNIYFFPFAVSDNCKEKYINIPKQEDSSSLLEILNIQKDFFGTSDALERKSVKTISLEKWASEYLPKAFKNGLLKVDVQGYEKNVLLGATNLFSSFKYIYIELSFIEFYKSQVLGWEIIRFLNSKDFKFIRIENQIYKGLRLVQADFLFERI